MPKGVFPRPPSRGLARTAAGQPQVRVPTALEQACRNFESEVGGREALIEHLVHAPLTADQELLVGAIADPRNDASSLARICFTFGIQFADLLQLFRSAGFVKAQLAALQKVWTLLPDVAGDVMARAVPHEVACATCAGTGTVNHSREIGQEADGTPKVVRWVEECESCRGTKVLHRIPSLDTQKLALEIGHLVQPKGVQVQVNQQQGVIVPQAHVPPADFYSAADRAVFDTTAEVVEDAPDFSVDEGPVEAGPDD